VFLVGAATLAAALAVAADAATVLVTVDEALALAFPAATVSRETLFLTDRQLQAAAELAGGEQPGAMVTRFVARNGDRTLGYGYLDTHRVRTLPETLLVILTEDGLVRRVEVVAFREPLEYLPRDGWYRQFDGQGLSDDLALKRRIRPVTGATLTASATTAAVRRVLAVHAAVCGRGAP
jgi:hypothetical protein